VEQQATRNTEAAPLLENAGPAVSAFFYGAWLLQPAIL
jgi:hypothetical protein